MKTNWQAPIYWLAFPLIPWFAICGCNQPNCYCVGVKNVSGLDMANTLIQDQDSGISFRYGLLREDVNKRYMWYGATPILRPVLTWEINGRHFEAVIELSETIRAKLPGHGEELMFELGESGVAGLYLVVSNEMEPGQPFVYRASSPVRKEEGVLVFTEFEN
jgi:hypothetical protein